MLDAAGTRMSDGGDRATCLAAAETGFASRNVPRVQAGGCFFFVPDVSLPAQRGGGASPEEDWHSIYTEDGLV